MNAATVKRAATSTELLLPGNITPITEAYIYARAAGYLKRRYVDIGDRVRSGQKLADIEAPDLDQQVSQAKAALAQDGVLRDIPDAKGNPLEFHHWAGEMPG